MNAPASVSNQRLVFIANTMYSSILSGGDVHTLNMAASAVKAGYPLFFLAGNALKTELERRHLPATIALTDKAIMKPRDFNTVGGQIALLWNFFGRFVGSMRRLSDIRATDIVYANTDYWWDSWPAILSRAERKMMILGMDCPTLWEIINKSRPDVRTVRFPSVHYWLSQHIALRWFRWCRNKRLLYVHPDQKTRLLGMGYRESELFYVANGFDMTEAEAVRDQERIYDVAWTGRVHKQKGIDDLLETLKHLASNVENFRAIVIGNVKQVLSPRIEALGIADKVSFSGYVSEQEKFRLLKSSRVFLMPSRYESWGIVVAEALACGTPVVGYDISAYRPVFGNLLRYVPPFDVAAFKTAAEDEVRKARAGKSRLDPAELAKFKQENSWAAAGERLLAAVRDLERTPKN